MTLSCFSAFAGSWHFLRCPSSSVFCFHRQGWSRRRCCPFSGPPCLPPIQHRWHLHWWKRVYFYTAVHCHCHRFTFFTEDQSSFFHHSERFINLKRKISKLKNKENTHLREARRKIRIMFQLFRAPASF